MSSSASIDKLELPNGIRNMGGYATAGKFGVPSVFAASSITLTQTNALTGFVTFTPPTNQGRYLVGGTIILTSGTNTGTVGLAINYVDVFGTTHTQDVIPLIKADGTIVQTGTAASTDWKAVSFTILVDNSATAISMDTVVVGSVHYLVTGFIAQV